MVLAKRMRDLRSEAVSALKVIPMEESDLAVDAEEAENESDAEGL